MTKTNYKMIKRFFQAVFIVLIVGVLPSCTKQEGYGGKSSIYGKVLERKYNNSGVFQNEYYIPEKRVYIVFGGEDFYGDDQYTCSTCWCEGGQGKIRAFDWLDENFIISRIG